MPGIDSNTIFMGHFNGSDGATSSIDSSPLGHAITFIGTAQIDTAQSKFGGSSLLLDGDSDYVSLPDNVCWDFGTGDFTIDFWARYSSMNTWPNFIDIDGNLTGVRVSWGNWVGGTFEVYCKGTEVAFTLTTATLDQWYHIAVVRTSGSIKVFVDGVLKNTTTASGDITGLTNGVRIGYNFGVNNYFAGWIDEFRISNIARWTTDFTPPTTEYSSDSLTAASDIRTSMIGIDMPWLHVYPFADGSISAADRQHIAYKYRNIAAQTPSVGGVPYRTLMGVGA